MPMYENLIREMAVRKVSIEDIAQFLDKHRNTISNRLNGSGRFSIEDSFAIKKEFFPDLPLEYLFEFKQ
jgi:hypothetical protein